MSFTELGYHLLHFWYIIVSEKWLIHAGPESNQSTDRNRDVKEGRQAILYNIQIPRLKHENPMGSHQFVDEGLAMKVNFF